MIGYFGDWVYTSTEIGGFLIEEPMTSLTDMVTGVVGVLSYFRLRRLRSQDEAHRWFMHYFIFIGIATLSAGILGHATQYIVGFNAKTIGWTLSALALFCLENSALRYFQKVYPPKQLDWLRYVFILQFLAYLFFVINPSTRVFTLVKINSVIGMVVLSLPLFYAYHRKVNSKGSKMVVLAFLASFLPGIVFNSEFSLHQYMNFHDIGHLLMAGCVYFLYRSCKQLTIENQTSKV